MVRRRDCSFASFDVGAAQHEAEALRHLTALAVTMPSGEPPYSPHPHKTKDAYSLLRALESSQAPSVPPKPFARCPSAIRILCRKLNLCDARVTRLRLAFRQRLGRRSSQGPAWRGQRGSVALLTSSRPPVVFSPERRGRPLPPRRVQNYRVCAFICRLSSVFLSSPCFPLASRYCSFDVHPRVNSRGEPDYCGSPHRLRPSAPSLGGGVGLPWVP